MTQKEQKNQIKNLLACAERLLCCMTEVQQDMDEAAKSIKQQKLLSDEIASKLENKLKELREETKNYTDICGETGIKNLMESSMSEAKHVLTEQLQLIDRRQDSPADGNFSDGNSGYAPSRSASRSSGYSSGNQYASQPKTQNAFDDE